ncbi:MAG TPA: DUF1800 domain-containing protein [Aquabacterium sp.]|nr:DUF1800 domain-containing protein [Aquabacterium sp.]
MRHRVWHQAAGIAILCAGLAACGGASEKNAEPISDSDAVRFLEQASFGPTPQDMAHLQSVGYSQWIDEQYSKNSIQPSHLQTVEASAVARGATRPDANDVNYSWWTHAIQDNAQLRQRVAFALSEIFVVSTNSDLSTQGRMVASYMDMLARDSSGTYRQLLEDVAMHPAMGTYLSHKANRKEDPTTGRVPDENFAREVMQLFSIGLYELNPDGSLKLNNGQPIETYNANDVKGLAKVFTGFSWNWPSTASALAWWKCFWRTSECNDPGQEVSAMMGYTQEHSTSEKQFLGVTVAAQSTPNPQLSLKTALDRLANHPNTAPFISRQLIQRLVTSNPSAIYVNDVASVFRSSGGNLQQVVKAILLHPEARHPGSGPATGKLREPILRITHLMRALPITSDTYSAQASAGAVPYYPLPDTDNPGTALSQTPMRSPSVFNFFRPGYKPPQTELGARDLVSPEMQLTTETTVIGYANFVSSILNYGWGGRWNSTTQTNDVRFDLSGFTSLADQPQQLFDAVSKRLLGNTAPDEVSSEAVAAISAMPNTTASDQRRRVQAAILMVAVSPAFIVQQ